MELKYAQEISKTLGYSLKQVESIARLHEEGSTIPFIARYRKEATGNLDEVQIGDVIGKIKYFEELGKRKDTILKTIDGLGKLTPELKKRIE
ncbi:MAG TPA: Tex-like N-terminal domain-containing protein, partial [Chitinophagaceae bacterium]|nr:Tex-like N-terminal domain-containing protein [Chitinophagaceae bacterium]